MLASKLSQTTTSVPTNIFVHARSFICTEANFPRRGSEHILTTAVCTSAAVVFGFVAVPTILFAVFPKVIGGRHTTRAITDGTSSSFVSHIIIFATMRVLYPIFEKGQLLFVQMLSLNLASSPSATVW
jgi:hypothetical protein